MAGDGLNSRGGCPPRVLVRLVEAGEIVYCGNKKIDIVAQDLKSRKKEFLNRYTRRMCNSRVRYVIASKGRMVVK